MVHKKSEYRLQFHRLPKDLRKQIWEDNVKFREGRRSINQADHYWAYQLTDEKCDCDNVDDDDDDTALPPHKVKHRSLLAKYELEKATPKLSQDVPGPASPNSKPQLQGESPNSNSKLKCNEEQKHVMVKEAEGDLSSARERAVQTPDWGSEAYREPANIIGEVQNGIGKLNLSSPDDRREYYPLPSSRWSERPLPAAVEDSRPRPTSALSYRQDPRNICRRSQSRNSENSCRHISPSRFSSLTRTSRRSFCDDRKKSPFAYYGWNEADTDVGKKKTYNVSAPKKEVHRHALKAMQQRKKDIQNCLSLEAEKLRESQSSRMSVNDSAIWVSEYQENFNSQRSQNAEKISRPTSTSILKKPVSWRYS